MVKAYTDKHKLDQYSEIVNSTKFAKTEIDPGRQCWGKDLNMYDEVDEHHLKWRGKKKVPNQQHFSGATVLTERTSA